MKSCPEARRCCFFCPKGPGLVKKHGVQNLPGFLGGVPKESLSVPVGLLKWRQTFGPDVKGNIRP